ncbi:MAG: hypothetical protein B6245_12360 [Desulfobacteraceae bacterium 4572_88]|nr:MAG: hypothetical protein B6245_12360 [Desulfobacteraceae bacterium 4572_88]
MTLPWKSGEKNFNRRGHEEGAENRSVNIIFLCHRQLCCPAAFCNLSGVNTDQSREPPANLISWPDMTGKSQ